MNAFSLRTIIDDILLLVRNNQISESEDLSRSQIAAWVLQYRAYFIDKKKLQDKQTGEDEEPDDTIMSTIGPLEIIIDPDFQYDCDCKKECCKIVQKRTKDKVYTLLDSADDIISVHDISGCVIQYMHQMRNHYHKFRRYTWNEPTCWFDNGYIYINGNTNNLKYIYIYGYFDPNQYADDEDDVKIPEWMVPDIKKAILANELSFMLNRPSDNTNNSSLSDVKPHDYQDLKR